MTNLVLALVVAVLSVQIALLSRKMGRFQKKLERFMVKEEDMQSDVSELVAQVAATATVAASATVAITGILARLDAATNMEEVRQATADLRAVTEPLAAAVASIPPEVPAAPAP